MPYCTGHTPGNKGKITTTEPIKGLDNIAKIKDHLHSNPRDLAMFTLGINSAFRSGDILNMKRSDLRELPDGRMEVLLRERKTSKLRKVVLNVPTAATLRTYIQQTDGEYVFEGQRGKMTTSYYGRLVKRWCAAAGLEGRFATHSLRKTFARTNYEVFGASLATLMFALNHDSERTTLCYLGLMGEDVDKLYQHAL